MKRKADGVDVSGRQPGFYLYPEDLERELRPLPLEAQALWIRMLLQMHFSPRRGYLEHSSGLPYSTEDIARLVGVRKDKVENLLISMEKKYGTFSRSENGVIFNRRMVRDTAISKIRKEAGAKGGNPALKDLDNQNPPDGPDLLNQSSNQNSSKNGNPRAGAKPSPIPLPFPSPPEGLLHTHRAHPARAADLNGQTSGRFEELWGRWPRQTAKDAAAAAWCSYVTLENEVLVFACLERFLGSGDCERGAIPHLGPTRDRPGWLADCARDGWRCKWPPPRAPVERQRTLTPIEQFKAEVKNGTRKI